MKYLKVYWHHEFEDQPVILYSEIDDKRIEFRKVEVYSDGGLGYAGEARSFRTMGLSTVPIPPTNEIAEDKQFEVHDIARAEFEEIWRRAVGDA